jgi:hypothetical protein
MPHGVLDLPLPEPASSNTLIDAPEVEYSCTRPAIASETYRFPPEKASPSPVPNQPVAEPNPDSSSPVAENSCTSTP